MKLNEQEFDPLLTSDRDLGEEHRPSFDSEQFAQDTESWFLSFCKCKQPLQAFVVVFAILGFELKALSLLGRCCTTSAMLPRPLTFSLLFR
jgi:hypothetical protein